MFNALVVKCAAPLAFITILMACPDQRFERDFFFKQPAATRLDRMRNFPLEEQYRLFRYGNDKFEPPLMGLAKPIAEKGERAVPFLVAKLNTESDDISVRDVLLIFDTMAAIKSYDVKSNAPLMEKLHLRVSAMKDAEWKAICLKTLRSIESN
jgi:hypothetical protein